MSSDNEDKTMFAMRINKSEKNELRKLYADMGLDLSTAVNLFFKQSLLENGLPFRPTRTADSNAERKWMRRRSGDILMINNLSRII
ncbi:type II toxin-antitoxin system RelB/DinJ family antitoxin [Lactiplantibacillus plantarum]